MTTLLAPTYALQVGSKRWTTQLVRLEVVLELAPGLDELTAVLPAAAPFDSEPGDPVALTLDNGEGEADVFAGRLDSIQRGFDEIRLTAFDAGGALAQVRPSATYEQVTAATIVRNLCSDAGVDVGDLADGQQLPFYVADPSRTALEHIARVSAWNGALARVGSDGRVETVVLDASQAELALRSGREVLRIAQDTLAAPIERFVVAGEAGAGESSAPEAHRPVTDFFAGSRPDGPSASTVWRFEPALRTAAAAATAGAALERAYRADRAGGTLETWLLAGIRPGTVFEIQDLPDGLAVGPFWAYHVRHRLSGVECSTRVRYHGGGDAFDPMSLLGSLAGLAGSLL
jgi:hypothetical protein